MSHGDFEDELDDRIYEAGLCGDEDDAIEEIRDDLAREELFAADIRAREDGQDFDPDDWEEPADEPDDEDWGDD